MEIMVTGGAGFIGSNFIRYISENYPDDEIICVDSLTYAGNPENLSGIAESSRFRFYKADISDREAVYGIFENEKPDMAVNFAAESHVDRSIKSPDVFLKTNVLGTQVLLDACRKYGIKRYHQISTDEVYGNLPLDNKELMFTEETRLNPSSPYSASKASADLLVMAYRRTYGLPVTISRCSNNYGEYQFPEKFIPLTIINALCNKPIPVYGTGKNIRDWLYVGDHCRAVDMILRRGREGEVYNIGGHGELCNTDVARLILKIMGKPEDLITFVEDRKGHDLRYAVNAEKITAELNWQPETDFSAGLEKTVNWYLNHKEWWKNTVDKMVAKGNSRQTNFF